MKDEDMAPNDEDEAFGDDDLADSDLDLSDLSEIALTWVKRNKKFLNAGRFPAGERPAPKESKKKQPELWDMEDWEEFYRWANNRIEQLEAREQKLKERLANAHTTYGSASAEMRRGMEVIESIIGMQTGVELNPPKMTDTIEIRIALIAMDLARRTTE